MLLGFFIPQYGIVIDVRRSADIHFITVKHG